MSIMSVMSVMTRFETILVLLAASSCSLANQTNRDEKVLSLFSVVQFPNQVCTTESDSLLGTCLASSECTSAGGTASGQCAAGFGVCCLITTSTCSSTISNNNTYITNPGFPSTYTPSATGTCIFTVKKCSDDVCQLRLDFQTFTGFTAASTGACTDKFDVSTNTGVNPPTICGTNTGYHMYVEIGRDSGDTASLKVTYGGTTSTQFNIFVRQIECNSLSRAPTDCVQYYTGTSGTIRSFNWGGSQLLRGMDYRICIRDEEGYCSISYKESSGTTIDAFSILNPAAPSSSTAEASTGQCIKTGGSGLIIHSGVSSDGIIPLNPALVLEGFPSQFCGGLFGTDGSTSSGQTLTSARKPFELSLFTAPAATITSPSTGFSLDYSQNGC